MKSLPLALLTLIVAAPSALADFASPNLTESTASSGLNTPLRNAPRVYQAFYSASNFTSITTPQLITGIEFRLALGNNSGVAAAATWPSQDLNFTQYDVQLSEASAAIQTAGQISPNGTTFAENQGGTVVTTRSGALTIPANSFSNLGSTETPNPSASRFNLRRPIFTRPVKRSC